MASSHCEQRALARMLRPRPMCVRGFTLVELLTVVVLLVVFSIIAVPSFSELIASQRVQAASMDLFTSLLRARSEAIKQNTDVTLSPTGTWDAGWAVMAGGTVIDSHAATTDVSISDPGVVTYRNSGRLAGLTQPKFSISATQTSTKRCVKAALTGEPAVTDGAC